MKSLIGTFRHYAAREWDAPNIDGRRRDALGVSRHSRASQSKARPSSFGWREEEARCRHCAPIPQKRGGARCTEGPPTLERWNHGAFESYAVVKDANAAEADDLRTAPARAGTRPARGKISSALPAALRAKDTGGICQPISPLRPQAQDGAFDEAIGMGCAASSSHRILVQIEGTPRG